MMTTYERGQFAERRETALLLIEGKFGPLSAEIKQRIESMSPEDLRRLTLAFIKAESLKDLHLVE